MLGLCAVKRGLDSMNCTLGYLCMPCLLSWARSHRGRSSVVLLLCARSDGSTHRCPAGSCPLSPFQCLAEKQIKGMVKISTSGEALENERCVRKHPWTSKLLAGKRKPAHTYTQEQHGPEPLNCGDRQQLCHCPRGGTEAFEKTKWVLAQACAFQKTAFSWFPSTNSVCVHSRVPLLSLIAHQQPTGFDPSMGEQSNNNMMSPPWQISPTLVWPQTFWPGPGETLI